MKAVLFAALQMMVLPGAAHATSTAAPTPTCIDPAREGAWFRPIRSDERFCLRAREPSDPWWFALKNLGDDPARYSLGGELRARYEDYQPVRAGLRGGRDDAYMLYRGIVHLDARFTGGWRAFGELGYWNSAGRDPVPAPTDVNRGDVSQLFMEWTGSNQGFVRLGRQQVLFGSGRLIGIRHAPNIRLSFDGVRVAHPVAAGRLDVFHLRPVGLDPASYNDREDARERIAGVYWTRNGVAAGLNIDAYAFRFERGLQRYQNGTGRERRTVVGSRVFGRHGRFALNSELTVQRGTVGTQAARGWSLQNDTQWRQAPESNWLLGLKTSHASGDRNPGDGRVETFQPVYAAPPFLMQSSFFFPANLDSLQPYIEWALSPQLTFIAEAQGQWRREKADGYYAPPMVVTRLDTRGTFLGTQSGLTLRYQPRRDLMLEAWASRLWVAGPLERAGARDTTFLATMATWSF